MIAEAPPRPRKKADRVIDALLNVAGSALQKIQARRGHDITGQWVFTVQLEEDELDGGYVAECLELPGCLSQGETEEEALENIVDAITGVLEAKMQRHLQGQHFEFDSVEASANGPRRHAVEIPVT